MAITFKASENYIEEICEKLGLNSNITMRIVLDFQVRQVPRAHITVACSDDVLSFSLEKEGLDLTIAENIPKRKPVLKILRGV